MTKTAGFSPKPPAALLQVTSITTQVYLRKKHLIILHMGPFLMDYQCMIFCSSLIEALLFQTKHEPAWKKYLIIIRLLRQVEEPNRKTFSLFPQQVAFTQEVL